MDCSAGGLPGLAVSRLDDGAQAPEALFELFQDWQGNTHSIFWEGPSWLRQQHGCLVLQSTGITAGVAAERHDCELKLLKRSFHALLPGAAGELLPS